MQASPCGSSSATPAGRRPGAIAGPRSRSPRWTTRTHSPGRWKARRAPIFCIPPASPPPTRSARAGEPRTPSPARWTTAASPTWCSCRPWVPRRQRAPVSSEACTRPRSGCARRGRISASSAPPTSWTSGSRCSARPRTASCPPSSSRIGWSRWWPAGTSARSWRARWSKGPPLEDAGCSGCAARGISAPAISPTSSPSSLATLSPRPSRPMRRWYRPSPVSVPHRPSPSRSASCTAGSTRRTPSTPRTRARFCAARPSRWRSSGRPWPPPHDSREQPDQAMGPLV